MSSGKSDKLSHISYLYEKKQYSDKYLGLWEIMGKMGKRAPIVIIMPRSGGTDVACGGVGLAWRCLLEITILCYC
jgi:hypothetical protein